MRVRTTTQSTLEDVDVECTHCGKQMTAHLGSGTTVRYFQCSSCHRWVTSMYAGDVFRVDAKVRPHPRGTLDQRNASFDQIKDRLDRWLAALDDQDPYRILGVSPLDPPERIRERYRELAIINHPDRGGAPGAMEQLNDAYERILNHRERRAREQLNAGPTAQFHELPQGV